MKKWILGFAAIVLTFSLTACGSGTKDITFNEVKDVKTVGDETVAMTLAFGSLSLRQQGEGYYVFTSKAVPGLKKDVLYVGANPENVAKKERYIVDKIVKDGDAITVTVKASAITSTNADEPETSGLFFATLDSSLGSNITVKTDSGTILKALDPKTKTEVKFEGKIDLDEGDYTLGEGVTVEK